ncbi:uncharacterized protein LOC135346190 isoform X3 [Halichondria panicea]
MKTPSVLLLTSLLLYLHLHLGEGQNTSGRKEWRKLICHKPDVQGGRLEIKMDTCDITTVGAEGTCSHTLITKKLLKNVCSVSYKDSVSTYTCFISHDFTGSACCYFYDSEAKISHSCLPKITPTPTSTPSSTKLSVTSATVSTGATPTPSSENKHVGNGNDSNTGIIAVVVVILVILVIVMLPLIVLWCVRRRQRNQGYDYQEGNVDNLEGQGGNNAGDGEADVGDDNPEGQGRNNAEDVRVVNPGGDNAEDGVPVVNPGGNNAKDGVPVVNLIVPGGDNAGGGVDNPGDIVDRDSVRNKARWSGETKGGEKPNKPQKNPQLVSRDGPKAQSTLRNRFKPKTVEMTRRPLKNAQEETEIKEDSKWLPTRAAVPFSEDSGRGCTSKSVMQPFPNIYEPPTVDSIVLDTSSTNAPTASQASDDENSPYVPMLSKSSPLAQKLNNKDLVTTRMSHLKCKDGTQEKPSISPVVQGHMQSLDQDDQEAEALVVQQKDKVKKDTSSVVACKRQSCFKSDDQTRDSVSGKNPLKRHKFPLAPVFFGTVLVAITCLLTLATCVFHSNPSTFLLPICCW